MDRRSLILLIVTCGLLVLWQPLIKRMYPDRPAPVSNPTAQPTNVSASGTGSTNLARAADGTPAQGPVATPQVPAVTPLRPGVADAGFRAPAGETTELALEGDELRVVLTSHGGGIKTIELKQHEDAIVCRERKAGLTPARAEANRWAVTPMMTVLGVDEAGAVPVYELSRTNDAVVARRDLGGGLTLVKEFRLQTNHLLQVTSRFQNWSGAARILPSHEWVFGTAAPLHAKEEPMYLGLFEHDGSSSKHVDEAWFANRYLGCMPGTPYPEYLSDRTNTVWAAVHNQFFATIVMPEDRACRVFSRRIDLAVNGRPAGAPPLPGFQTALLYPAEEIPPQNERVRKFGVYVGPKEYSAISNLGNGADVVMGFDNYFGGRFSGFFARTLLLAMNGLHRIGLSYALAIIAITVTVRLLFWPLMRASAQSSKRMAALQPRVKELQEKYKDNPQKMNQKMLELWREHKINPASGCLPILIQFPILLGFYAMLQTAIELRGASFLWACDLSQSDTIGILPGLGFPINPLPLMMGGTMLWQAQVTPMSPSMDATQQKIMKYMPLMFMVFLYNFSAGLTLYWTVSNLLSIAQMKLTRSIDGKTGTAVVPAATSPVQRPGRKQGPGARSS